MIDDRTPFLNLALPNENNTLLEDVARLRAALGALDTAVNGKATPANITTAINNVLNGAPAALDTLAELSAALGNDANYAATITAALALKAPLASPTFTGTVTAPTFAGNLAWSYITSKPTTISGYGITDAITTGNIGSQSVSYATTSGTATYVSATRQINTILGVSAGLSMSADSGATVGSYTTYASGAGGDGNLSGLSFTHSLYAIKLGVRGDGYFGLGGWSRSAWSWYSDPSGNMVAAGNVTAYSDPRLKENFERVADPFGILSKLDGGTFNWKAGIPHTAVKAGNRDYGVLADQVCAVMPEIVTNSIEIEGEVYQTVAYEKLVPVLIEAVKELHAEIQILKGLRNA